jgi:iron(III) transport system substrate-binding protein
VPRKKLSRTWIVVLVVAIGLVVSAVGLVAATDDAGDALVVYNGRSHYGGDDAFAAFTRETGIKVKLFGGDAETLHQRLRSEGEHTPADVLVTVDGANLSRAKAEGLLMPLSSGVVDAAIPAGLRDPDGTWTALSTRVRTPMRSLDRVGADDVRTYEDLGDRKWRGRVCLRTSNNIYNQSLVADLIAKRGEESAETLLRSWMANDPKILGSDIDVLKAIQAGQCDVGLANHYYLARLLKDDPRFPVAPAWAGQDGAGAHANISGVGIVRATDRADDARRLVEFLVRREAQEAIAANGEFPANPDVDPAPHVAAWRDVQVDPIGVDDAGRHAEDAVALMAAVGWK